MYMYMYVTVNRDEAQNKMLALKEKADKEMSQYNTELKELARIIDHDRKLREFMSRKDQERTEAHEEMEAMKRKREAEKNSEREGTVMVSGRIVYAFTDSIKCMCMLPGTHEAMLIGGHTVLMLFKLLSI